ncbi:unnamed protein product [Auanema sp. JU1783]|nr:unnamed protein product [Auanema sp. JU1783]
MTTAHRPTFNPARGGMGRGEGDLSKLSQQYSSKDMPSHTKLKYRVPGQGTEEELRRRDLRRELEDKEETARDRKLRDSSSAKKPRLEEISQGPTVDADDDEPYDDDLDSDDEDDDADNAADIAAELERIRKERKQEKEEIEEKEKEREENIRMENILSGNPLLNKDDSSEFKVKRRWDDDVVFKNCAKGIDERKKESSFINDAIRSEFHRKFMDKLRTGIDQMTLRLSRKLIVFVVTFCSYGLYHSSRKTLSGVKSSVKTDWLDNTTHLPLFEDETEAKNFLGALDAIFMGCYAAALFFWGWLGDRFNPKVVVAVGMIGSAVTLTMFGAVPKWISYYSVPYYVFTYVLFGIVQACGWPSEIAIMANWFGGSNRGFIMGVWAACQPVGNIFGSMLTAVVLPFGYEYTFAVNSALIFVGSIIVLFGIDSKPVTGHHEIDSETGHGRTVTVESEGEPIGFLKAVLLPGVLAYCLCNACLKLVNYAFFFWLPLYLTDAYNWSEAEADQLSIWYDIGGIIGSVAGGYISDRMGCRTPLIVSMLVCSLGALMVYADIGAHMVLNAIVMTAVGITISGPYNLIVGSISIDLGSQPILAGNSQAMSTVSGLLDGTGSVGSALGQLIIPLVQNSLGWKAVFYLFISLNGVAILCILKKCILDLKSLRRYPTEHTPLLTGENDHED